MSTSVEAIYEAGVFRPLFPLPLEEHTRVKLSIESLAPEPRDVSHRFASADLAGAFDLTGGPATNARARESLRRQGDVPGETDC
jgi:predicted DNA-binding antitoxin AbrB/MazE fold protein